MCLGSLLEQCERAHVLFIFAVYLVLLCTAILPSSDRLSDSMPASILFRIFLEISSDVVTVIAVS